MNSLVSGQLHYVCHLQIRSLKPSFNRTSLLRFIKGWIANRHRLEPDHPLRRTSLFYKGLDEPWTFIPGTSCTIETAVYIGSGSEGAPEYWVLRYQHPDLGRSPLHWTCDIAVRQLSELLDFRLRIRHSAVEYGQGIIPEHRVPGLVHRLLSVQDEWLCLAGDDSLVPGFVPVDQSSLDIFVSRLFAPERRIPFLLITPAEHGQWLVDAEEWAEQLAGVAKVWRVADRDTSELLDGHLPPAYACYPGAIRFYLPGARPERDARPHQYIPASQLWNQRACNQALRETIRLLTRRNWEVLESSQIQDIDQLRSYAREQELARYKRELDEAARKAQAEQTLEQDPEYVRLLEQEVEDLQARLDQERQRAAELQNRAVQLEYLLQQQTQEHEWTEHLQKLPETLPKMMDLVQKLFPQRLAFTERAYKSARDAAFNRSRRLPDAWRLLWHMATTLYDLYFNSERVNVVAEFQDRSGFGLDLTEGRMTRDNRKLMALREDTWQGRRILIEPHTKIGTEAPNLLRIHYASLESERLLVIGHVGDHLPNRTSITKY